MPNAKDLDIHEGGKPKLLLISGTGGGKTSQIATLPGRTFAYLFDPSALSTLRGQDVDYETFYPSSVNLAAKSLSKDAKKDKSTGKEDASDIYVEWEADFEKRTKEGYWDSIDNIAFDSFTTFSDIVMDRILYLNGRPGQFPQRDDWTAQMAAIANVVRTLTAMNKLLLFTTHDEFKQDEATSRMQNVILLTGKLRVKMPLLFSEIFHMECQSTPKDIKYVMQTRPDRMNPTIRCTIRGLEMFEDVTIKDWSNPKGSGIGGIIKRKLGYDPYEERAKAAKQAGISTLSGGSVASIAGGSGKT